MGRPFLIKKLIFTETATAHSASPRLHITATPLPPPPSLDSLALSGRPSADAWRKLPGGFQCQCIRLDRNRFFFVAPPTGFRGLNQAVMKPETVGFPHRNPTTAADTCDCVQRRDNRPRSISALSNASCEAARDDDFFPSSGTSD